MSSSDVGPDIAIVGAARSGTSFLSAAVGRHSRVDPGSVKEPNYFSSRWGSGEAWYDQHFAARQDGVQRLDSSVSYTYPQHPDALVRLSRSAPHAKIIYSVRAPLVRLVSMYHLFRYYAAPDMFASLGEAIDTSQMCLMSGDYDLWLTRIQDLFPTDQILVVPFPLTTTDAQATLDVVLPWLGLANESGLIEPASSNYRNEVRQFRWSAVGRLQRRMHRSPLYPRVRARLSPDRLRAMRRLVTRSASIPGVATELATLTTAQRATVEEVSARAVAAVEQWLSDQDARLGVDWSTVWTQHVSESVTWAPDA